MIGFGLNVKERYEYILKREKGTADSTIFVFRPLTAGEYLNVLGSLDVGVGDNKDQIIKKLPIRDSIENCIVPTLEKSIVEIRNIFSSEEQKAVTISNITKDIITSFSLDVLSELYEASLGINKLDEDEEKN